jgi:hypothetical protein
VLALDVVTAGCPQLGDGAAARRVPPWWISPMRVLEAVMGIVLAGAALVAFYAGERVISFVRRARIETRRAAAEYPITENDPVGRIIV